MENNNITTTDAVTIRNILRVNHAGELGAIRIYQAQILISKLFFPDIALKLEELLAHEKEHCRIFFNELRARDSRPCYVSFLWALGGSLLGLITACMGRSMIMVCTEAVEETVHKHLDEQIKFLSSKDQVLRKIIYDIQQQELEHLDFAKSNLNQMNRNLLSKLIYKVVSIATEFLIFLSTYGQVVQMRKSFTNHKQ